MKKHTLRTYDFIRSWLYYPRMKKYLSGIGIEYPMSRLQYALWHCRVGRLSDEEFEKITIIDKTCSYEYTYNGEPIERI